MTRSLWNPTPDMKCSHCGATEPEHIRIGGFAVYCPTPKVPCPAHSRLNGGTLSQYQPWCPSCRAMNVEATK